MLIKNKNLTLRTLTIALGMATTLGMASQASAELGYVDAAGENVWKTSYGECWRGADGKHVKLEACGDDMGPKDSDGDGVMDDKDACPDTKAGAKIDSTGCEIIPNVTINLTEGEFDFDSAVLKEGMKASLADVASQIKASSGEESITIVGHTDSTGASAYNQSLSEARAASAAEFLVSEGIAAGSISTKGMGEDSPVADNATRTGRADNRRVDIITE